MTDIVKLQELLARVENAEGPDVHLDRDIYEFVLKGRSERVEWDVVAGDYTKSIDAAVSLCERVLSGWWWKVGTCCVSDDACVAPDYNSPEHGERLKLEFPLPTERYPRPGTSGASPTTWGPYDEGFDIDRRPPGNVALALCQAILEAKLYIAEKAET